MTSLVAQTVLRPSLHFLYPIAWNFCQSPSFHSSAVAAGKRRFWGKQPSSSPVAASSQSLELPGDTLDSKFRKRKRGPKANSNGKRMSPKDLFEEYTIRGKPLQPAFVRETAPHAGAVSEIANAEDAAEEKRRFSSGNFRRFSEAASERDWLRRRGKWGTRVAAGRENHGAGAYTGLRSEANRNARSQVEENLRRVPKQPVGSHLPGRSLPGRIQPLSERLGVLKKNATASDGGQREKLGDMVSRLATDGSR